jgi:putative ABC transport system permease protein
MRIVRRLAVWLRLSSHHADLQDELALHREMIEQDLARRGMTAEHARAVARRAMGNETYMREESRAVWLRPWIEGLVQDATYARRALRRDPKFSAGVILTLALGIGATGAVFSILRAVLLQPLPYRNPSELVIVGLGSSGPGPKNAGLPRFRSLSASLVIAWRQDATNEIGEIAGFLPQSTYDGPLDISLGDRAERLNAAAVTPNFFELLGARAAQGRVFNTADEASGEPLILLSNALALRLFGRNRAIAGQSITLTGGSGGTARTERTFTIAGVLPRGFHYNYPDEIEAWVLMRWSDVERFNPAGGPSVPRLLGFFGVARLRPGISLALAQQRAADVTDEGGRLEQRLVGYRGSRFELQPIHDWVVGETRPSLQLLGGVAALLLLITCVTVANGLLARFSERQQELAVRTALGAGRARLVRQLLTEGAVLSVAGAIVGTVVVIALMPALRALLPASVPRVGELTANGYVLAFGAVIAALTTTLAAVAPAYGGTRLDAGAILTRAMSAASAGRQTVRWRQALLGTQAAIGTALLISAALLLTSFWQLRRVPLGYDGDQAMTVELRLLDARYVMRWSIRRFQDELIARVRTIPGVEAAMASAVPFAGSFDPPVDLKIPGFEKPALVRYRRVDPDYFRLLRVPAVRGRLLTDADRDGTTPVAVISESLARQAFGTENPIGRTIGSSPVLQVVGVVADLYYANLERDPGPSFYIPRAQDPTPIFSLIVRVNATTSTTSVVSAIRREIREMDPALPIPNFATIGQLVDTSVANRRFYTVATVAFASLALLLTIAGLIVVVGRVVSERRTELAIRSALGASSTNLVHVATRSALLAASIGVAVGIGAAYAASGVLGRFLFQVAPRSPGTYSAVAVTVLTVATLAALVPVRRFNRAPLAALLKAE